MTFRNDRRNVKRVWRYSVKKEIYFLSRVHTQCEISWIKITMLGSPALYAATYYWPTGHDDKNLSKLELIGICKVTEWHHMGLR